MAEVIELAGNLVREKNESVIETQYIQMAIERDEELRQLFKVAIFPCNLPSSENNGTLKIPGIFS